jgi:hypothetical protein
MIGTDLVLLAAVDWIWLAKAAPGAAMLAMFGGLALMLIRRGRTFRCPSCRREVSRSAIRTEEILCPRCGWHAVRVGPEEDAAETGPIPADAAVEDACRYCGRALSGEAPVRLWDGHDYCRPCVDGACPGLAEHAAQSDLLEETLPHSPLVVAGKLFALGGGAGMAFFGTFLVLAGWQDSGLVGGLQGLLLAALLVLPMIGLCAGVSALRFAHRRPSVSVTNGHLEVRTGDVWSARYPLSECQWFFGDSKRMNLLEKVMPPGGPAMLIVLPREQGGMYDKLAAVGFSEASRRRWAAFLTLARLTRRTAWEKRLPLWRKAANVLAVAVLMPAAFAGCCLFGVLLGQVVADLSGDAGLGHAVAVVCIFPGGFYVCFLIGLTWPWKPMKRVPSRRSLAHRKKVRRQGIAAFVLASAVFVALPLGLRPGFTPLSRVAGVTLSLLCGWLAGRDIGKRFASMEWERVERDGEKQESDA